MSLVAAEQQTCGRFLFFKDNKSVLQFMVAHGWFSGRILACQFMVATYVHGYIKPMQEVIFVKHCSTDLKFSVEDNL